MCEALSSSGNVDKTSRRFESHLASWKPPLERNYCYCLLMSIACSSLENDLSELSTQKSLNTASTTSGGKSRLLSLAVFLRACPATFGEDLAQKMCTSIC